MVVNAEGENDVSQLAGLREDLEEAGHMEDLIQDEPLQQGHAIS